MEEELKKNLRLAILLSVFISMLNLILPFNMLMLFWFVIPSESISNIYVIAFAATAGLLFMTIFDRLRFALMRRFSLRLNEELGEKILLGLLQDRSLEQKGSYSSAMEDLTRVRNFLNSPTSSAFLDSLVSPLQLAILFFISPVIGALAAVCILIILTVMLAGRKPTRELLQRANKHFAKVNNLARECVENSQAVAAMGMQPQLNKRWREMQDEMITDQTEASEKAGVHSAITKSMGWIMQVVLMGAGTAMMMAGTLDSGMAIIAVIIAGRVIMPMQMVVNGWKQYQNARDAFLRLKELLAELRKKEKKEILELPPPKGQLKAEALMYAIGGKPIIRGISFDLEAGQTLGLVGPSGAGKSTLARILTGVVPPHSGILRLDGADIHKWDQNKLGGYIGYLPQDVELFEGTVARNIARFHETDMEKILEAARKSGLDGIIGGMPEGYDTKIEERGFNLPGGLRRRIGLARALFGNPRILILDEPDANLDHEGLVSLVQIIKNAHEEQTTVILITHRLQLLQFTHQLLMIKNGQATMYGPTSQVLPKLLNPQAPQPATSPVPLGKISGVGHA
jgi:PrtD family type I secretion system ABC transporter